MIIESLQFNKAVISTSPIGIFIYQASGPCVSANAPLPGLSAPR